MYKLQIGGLIILIFIMIIFMLQNKKKGRMHTLFGVILTVSALQLVFDIASVYTVNHLETVNPILNRVIHQFYMGFLVTMFCFIYVYCVRLAEEKTNKKIKNAQWAMIALIVSYIGLLLLPLEYIENPITNYSYGPMAYMAYGSAAVYTAMTLCIMVKYWKNFEYKQKTAIAIAVITETVVFIYQALIPTSLISSLGVTIVNLGIFLSVESPDSILIEKLDEEKKRADAANNAKTAFVANMSHEIRTPINSVLGMNEMILRESKEESIRGYAGDIQYSAQALLAIINDILDIAKIETGKMEIIPVSYDLRDFLYNVVNMMSLKARTKDLELEVFVDESLPNFLEGDDIRIRQILVNLLNNAVKYTHRGKVTLQVKKDGEEKDKVRIKYVIKDTGIGIKEEDIQKLFVAFERIEEKRNRNIEGTGLGINICVHLLEMMKSSLKVESEYGKGSTFSFVLEQKVIDETPVGEFDAEKRREMELSKYKAFFTAPKARVLVVDDNSMNRKVFRNLLKQTQVQVDEADNGENCLKMLVKAHYDIIFMDHMMPGMDGVETFHAMKELKGNLCIETPVVILTANAVIGAKENYLKEGFNAFLSKPVEPDKLEKIIFEMLPKELIQENCAQDGNIQNDIRETIEFPIIDGVDFAYGRLHFPTDEDLLEAVELLYRMLKTEADALEKYYADLETEGGLNSYRIQVHSMKNSAALIGIVPLSGMAKVLEDSARNGDKNTIYTLTPIFLNLWRSYKEKLFVLFEKKEEARNVYQKDKVIELVECMQRAAGEFDISEMDHLMEMLNSYKYEGILAEKMEQLSAMVGQFDIEQTIAVSDEVKKLL